MDADRSMKNEKCTDDNMDEADGMHERSRNHKEENLGVDPNVTYRLGMDLIHRVAFLHVPFILTSHSAIGEKVLISVPLDHKQCHP